MSKILEIKICAECYNARLRSPFDEISHTYGCVLTGELIRLDEISKDCPLSDVVRIMTLKDIMNNA